MDPKKAEALLAQLRAIHQQAALVVYARLLLKCGVRQKGMQLYQNVSDL